MIIVKHLALSGYKSIEHLDLEFGHLNVLIGANGSGKSNLLSFFKLLKYIPKGDLRYYISKFEAGANNILYYGAKKTKRFDAKVDFEDGSGDRYRYDFSLGYAADDRMIFEKEQYQFSQKVAQDRYETTDVPLGSGETESRLRRNSEKREIGMNGLCELLESCRLYHFNDTSLTAPIRQNTRFGNITGRLKSEGDNLAHILYRQSIESPSHYRIIVDCIRQVMPWFKEFVWEPNPQEIVQLKWRGEDPDYIFTPHQAPDGAIRAMALITLLLNCRTNQTLHNRVILIDEPELGLHPSAICTIASLIHDASYNAQVIIATQSPTLLDYFEPENVIVVDWEKDGSHFTRQSPASLEDWLKDYSLSELWEKNVIGGGPF